MRLGRICYVNMAPRLLRARGRRRGGRRASRRSSAGCSSTARSTSRRSRRSSTRATPTGSGSCRALCVSSEGAVDSIQLVTRMPVRPGALGRGHAGERDLGRARRGSCFPRPRSCRSAWRPTRSSSSATRRCGARSRIRRRTSTSAGSGSSGRACRWSSPSGRRAEPIVDGLVELEHALVASVRLARSEPERLARKASEHVRLSRRLPRPLLREAPLQLRAARARRSVHVPRDGPRRRRARRTCPSCASCARRSRRDDRRGRCSAVGDVLEKALDGERISDEDAVALLRSRDLVAVGRVGERDPRTG